MRFVGLDWAVQCNNRAAVRVERSHGGAIAITSVTTGMSNQDAASLTEFRGHHTYFLEVRYGVPRTYGGTGEDQVAGVNRRADGSRGMGGTRYPPLDAWHCSQMRRVPQWRHSPILARKSPMALDTGVST